MRAIVASAVAAAMLFLGATASAEIEPGNIPAETLQTAYPTQPGHTYNGAFQPDTATYHDLDYLAFTVASPGETVQFTLRNTTQGVKPNDFEFCPVYLSLLDQTNNQVGGSGRGAGTIATYGDTEVFDWTFQTPGTYYMVMESNGDMPAGEPTYAVSYKAPAPPGTPSAPLVRSLRVARHQHGDSVSARLNLGQRASVRVRLVTTGGKTVAIVKRTSLAAGSHRFRLLLPARYRQRHRISLTVKISVRGPAAKASFVRPVTLSP